MRFLSVLVLLLAGFLLHAQPSTKYEISFENAVHHQANVKATFSDLPLEVLEVRMSRSSPGRYAIHEFAKNVFNVKAVDSKGNTLTITRPDPYQWNVAGHDGTVIFTYTVFGDRGDGTYMQVDETHAHLNMPATFVFARGLDYRPVSVNYKIPVGSNWKVATQLKPMNDGTFIAPDLQYFMDSPAEISNFDLHSFDVTANGNKYTIRVALHHTGTKEAVDQYVAGVKKIVAQEMAVFGEVPDFDYGTYTFLGCYMPQASGDGMEHRNSTYVVGSRTLQGPAVLGALGTVSHEFFHCWNVERIRPASLEPFNFEEANMSGELWIAEGFTNYYTSLMLCRAGLITRKEYIEGLHGVVDFVNGSPARSFFNPIEMSYQAPFADAATSIDPNYRSNTFISYYLYGQVLGLALDLQLRNEKGSLSLDDFMKFAWNRFGKTELPYNVRDMQTALSEYASPAFASQFFNQYVFQSKMPDYEKLLASMGITYAQPQPTSSIGANFESSEGSIVISGYTTLGGPAYNAGLERGDQVTTVDNQTFASPQDVTGYIKKLAPGTHIKVAFMRHGSPRTTDVTTVADGARQTAMFEDVGRSVDKSVLTRRDAWLNAK